MAENRRGKDKRFYFNRAQLVLLGGAFTVASIIIFLLGIFVGKGIEERKAVKNEEPLAKIPVTPSEKEGSAGEKLTFYDTLTKPTTDKPSDEGERKTGEKPEKITKSANETTSRENKSPDKTSEQEAMGLKTDGNKDKANKPKALESSGDNRETWTVQVNAFPDERSAKIWVDRLKNKGYKAYVTEVRNRGKNWYRVRVGKFDSREAAEKLLDVLKMKENFTTAFATSK